MIFRRHIERACPPAFVRRLEVRMLTSAFLASAGEACVPAQLAGDGGLARFRALTHAVAENLAGDAQASQRARAELGRRAERLGRLARRVLVADVADALAIARYLYAGIGIDLRGELPGSIVVSVCSFAQTYTPVTCAFMSAMDEGVMRGLCGGGDLRFEKRLTEGCASCAAVFRKES